MAGGYTGKCCIEDLGTGKTEIIEPEDGFYRKYLSGCGLGAAVIMVRQKAGTDPLSPRSYLYAGLSGVMKNFPDIGRQIKQANGKQAKAVRRYTAGSFYMQLVNSCGMCLFGALTSTLPIVAWMNAATSWDFSPDEYLKVGERILSLRKAFNMREGILPADHQLSDRAIGKTPLDKGPLKGKTIDMNNLMREFYDTVGWDLSTGGLRPEKMKTLEIDQLIS